nr:reticulan like protein B13 [Tanacetum cinerariifolium]
MISRFLLHGINALVSKIIVSQFCEACACERFDILPMATHYSCSHGGRIVVGMILPMVWHKYYKIREHEKRLQMQSNGFYTMIDATIVQKYDNPGKLAVRDLGCAKQVDHVSILLRHPY